MRDWFVRVDVTLIKNFFLNFLSYHVVIKKLLTNFEKRYVQFFP